MGNDQSGFEAGDVIYRKMIGSGGKTTNYTSDKIGYHYGIYIGNDEVIAFTREDGIIKSSLDEFAAGHDVSKERVNICHSKEDTVQIAIYLYKNPDEWGD